jgi:hypothetical protein
MAVRVLSTVVGKKKRRTKVEIESIEQAIIDLLREDHPATVRGTFYRLVSAGVIDKTDQQYKNTVVRLMTKLRERGDLPYGWVTDSTRLMRKTRSWASPYDALVDTALGFKAAVWDDQSSYVELWTEKDAIAGVLLSATQDWDVPVMVARGFSSITFLFEAAQTIKAVGKPTHLYYFGDWDPSGVSGERHVEKKLRQYAPHAEIHFERVAVTPEQIVRFGLPTRPTKASDSRYRKWKGGRNVEVDALPPATIRELASRVIEQHIDPHVLEQTRLEEKAARSTLGSIAIEYGKMYGFDDPSEDDDA